MSASQFPLEPLCKVRGMRLRKLEADLKACREQWNAAEQLRLEAVARWEQAVQQRQDFAEASWKALFDEGLPTGEAMSRHERHLAWLDQIIVQCHAELEQRSRECAEAAAALEQASAAWRRAHNKLDALGEMKQEWLRESRNQQALREEHSLEELMLRRTTSR
jgi:flagellar biosynthesis chaperone FliJ